MVGFKCRSRNISRAMLSPGGPEHHFNAYVHRSHTVMASSYIAVVVNLYWGWAICRPLQSGFVSLNRCLTYGVVTVLPRAAART
jgi:hypothetical protein